MRLAGGYSEVFVFSNLYYFHEGKKEKKTVDNGMLIFFVAPERLEANVETVNVHESLKKL